MPFLRTPYRTLLILFGIFGLGTGPAWAQSAPPTVETHLAYTGETMGVASGGMRQEVVYLDNVDVTTTLRADSLIGWSGLTAFAYGLGNQGRNPSALVGDAQITSNIEAPLAWRLYEGWLQQTLGTRASVLAGLYDLNAEFDVNRAGALFLNSSHGVGAAFGSSGRNGPSIFPLTSAAFRTRVRIRRRGYVQAALLDGVPGRPSDPTGTAIRFGDNDGILVASEVGVYLGGPSPSRTAVVDRTVDVEAPGKLALGGWTYTTPLPEWPTVNTRGTVERSGGSTGVYALAEGHLFTEPGTEHQGLSGFGRIGWAHDRFARFGQYLGAGLVYTGLVPGRSADEVGLAVASAHNGEAYQNAQRRGNRPVTDAEINVEATYTAAVWPFLTVTGDLQYVINPNTDPTIPNALLGGLRFVVHP